jgi:hypothetical protein
LAKNSREHLSCYQSQPGVGPENGGGEEGVQTVEAGDQGGDEGAVEERLRELQQGVGALLSEYLPASVSWPRCRRPT